MDVSKSWFLKASLVENRKIVDNLDPQKKEDAMQR